MKRPRHGIPSRSHAQIDPHADLVPVEIVQALQQGMQEYIPLTLLTTKSCRDAVMGCRNMFKVEDGSLQFDATGENVMSVLDWRLASDRYVSLLAEYLLAGDDETPGGPTARAIAETWRWHFAEIMRRIERCDFEILRTYDIRVRRQFIIKPNSFRPDVWHEELYRDIFTDYLSTHFPKAKNDLDTGSKKRNADLGAVKHKAGSDFNATRMHEGAFFHKDRAPKMVSLEAKN